MAQVVAARLDVILRDQRLQTVRMDDDGSGGDIFLNSARASRKNAVTIAVNKVAFKEVKTGSTASGK